MAQSSVDPELDAKPVASIDNLDDFIKVANEAGYPLTKEGLTELSDQELSGVTGGVMGTTTTNGLTSFRRPLISFSSLRLKTAQIMTEPKECRHYGISYLDYSTGA